MRPSPLSSSRFTTIGVMLTCADCLKGAPTASFAGAVFAVPPHWISFVGSTFANGTGGSVHVGSLPVPVHAPTSQTVFGGQSQSSSHGQLAIPAPGSVHMLGKYVVLPQVY
jgi:hypothetical protein